MARTTLLAHQRPKLKHLTYRSTLPLLKDISRHRKSTFCGLSYLENDGDGERERKREHEGESKWSDIVNWEIQTSCKVPEVEETYPTLHLEFTDSPLPLLSIGKGPPHGWAKGSPGPHWLYLSWGSVLHCNKVLRGTSEKAVSGKGRVL